jgi:MFS family permease
MRERRSDALLVLICLAQFMVILDVSIVNVALPSIKSSLGFSDTGLQWVVNAYTLTFAGFLMLGGRACDIFGRREVFLAGTAMFAIASLACAVAESQSLLLGARALQGLGGATISPAGLAIIASSFAEGSERNRALGVWGAMAGLGAPPAPSSAASSPSRSAGRRSSSSTSRSGSPSSSPAAAWCHVPSGESVGASMRSERSSSPPG